MNNIFGIGRSQSQCHFSIRSLRDLADVLQEIVRLNDDMRPHLERYQELLRSGNDREVSVVFSLLCIRYRKSGFTQ